ncbi:MAG: 2-amino-4-hydroxy-6-hydroxymethyldihydropteridine diphosphokinase [Cyanobacteria bacterium P01_F01_bin.153]
MTRNSIDSPVSAAIALGGNLNNPAETFNAALTRLNDHPQISVTARSLWYTTPPMGPPQPDYLNGCALLETTLDPSELLTILLETETQLGRVREVHWGPRTLDLDLLLYGDSIIELPHLTVPHPGLDDRAFMLKPLADIAADWVDPRSGKTIKQLLQTVDCSEIHLAVN